MARGRHGGEDIEAVVCRLIRGGNPCNGAESSGLILRQIYRGIPQLGRAASAAPRKCAHSRPLPPKPSSAANVRSPLLTAQSVSRSSRLLLVQPTSYLSASRPSQQQQASLTINSPQLNIAASRIRSQPCRQVRLGDPNTPLSDPARDSDAVSRCPTQRAIVA